MIERLHQDGIWEGVLSEWYCDDQAVAGGFAAWIAGANSDAYYRLPQTQLRSRNYDLFNALSNARGPDNRNPAMTSGVPDDASRQYLTELDAWGSDAHSCGWAVGSTVRRWRRKAKSPLAAWAGLLEQVFASRACDSIMSARITGHPTFAHEEFAGTETAHETLVRAARSAGLLDWTSRPDAWRILVFYDN